MKNLFLPSFLLLLICNTNAQTGSINDTVEYARGQAYQNNFKEADSLLSAYNQHNADINGMRLHAQVLYWMKEFDRSAAVYENALRVFPDMKVVELDYGRMLWELKKLTKAQVLLNEYLTYDKENSEAKVMLAYISYWKGRNSLAKEQLASILNTLPTNQPALDLLNEINVVTAPYIKLGGQASSDDQPLKKSGFNVEAGMYNSWILSPFLMFNNVHSNPGTGIYNSWWVQAGNKISFGRSGVSLNFKGGLFSHPTAKDLVSTGAISFSVKLSSFFSVTAATERMPYQYTTASIKIPVMQQLSGSSLLLNKNNKWLGKAAIEVAGFDDDNKINTAYLWLMAPLVDKNSFKLKAGYAFNHSDADKNNFTSTQSIAAIVSGTAPGNAVPGYYYPYFTPSSQTAHSLLASTVIQLSKNVLFTSRASLGIAGKVDNPVLSLSKSPGNIFSIDKSYYQQTYNPIEFNNELSVRLTPHFSSAMIYEYSRLLFYTLNQGSISLKYVFINDKKKSI
jgi:hypothetical protein